LGFIEKEVEEALGWGCGSSVGGSDEMREEACTE